MNEELQLSPLERTEIERYADVAPVISIEQAIARHRLLSEYVKQVMREHHDYGAIPGTSGKPSLLKPGAEKLTTLFGLTKRLFIVEKTEDWIGQWDGEPFFYYLYRCALYRGELLIAEADGSCNSRESKYRWREAQRKCPHCGVAAIIKGKAEFGGGWICFQKKGGCGTKYAEEEATIMSQQVGRIANPDVADQVNTIQKMAAKRALVAATLLAVGASEFFTQDIEDFSDHPSPPATPSPQPPERNPTPAPPAAPPPNPVAQRISDLATPKQVVMMRALCQELQLDVEQEVQKLLNVSCHLEELSRRAASSFIDHLKQRQAAATPVLPQAAAQVAHVAPVARPVAPINAGAPSPAPVETEADKARQKREDCITAIKHLASTVKFAANLSTWRELEKGLLGCAVTEATDAELTTAREAITQAAANADIVRWSGESWVCSSEMKAYSLGLIIAHAYVDGFAKTKALVREPAQLRKLDAVQTMNTNLLSWVRPQQMAA